MSCLPHSQNKRSDSLENALLVVLYFSNIAMSDLVGQIIQLMDHTKKSQLIAAPDSNFTLDSSTVFRADGGEDEVPEYPEAGARPEGLGSSQAGPSGPAGGELAVVDAFFDPVLLVLLLF